MSDSDRVLFENMNGKLDLLLEATSLLAQDVSEVKSQVKRIEEIVKDIPTIKAVQREQGKDLRHISNYLIERGMPARA